MSELLSLCDALEAKLTQSESASTQLLAAAVHHLLHEDSREAAKENSRINPLLFATPRLRVTPLPRPRGSLKHSFRHLAD